LTESHGHHAALQAAGHHGSIARYKKQPPQGLPASLDESFRCVAAIEVSPFDPTGHAAKTLFDHEEFEQSL